MTNIDYGLSELWLAAFLFLTFVGENSDYVTLCNLLAVQ